MRCTASVPAGPGWPGASEPCSPTNLEGPGHFPGGRRLPGARHQRGELGRHGCRSERQSAVGAGPLARAGPGALAVGAPPVAGRLVRELRARGATLPEPVCARCGRAHPKLAVTGDAGLCPRCRARHNATACGRCGVVKVVYGRGLTGEALCSVCAPRPERRCSRCGRVRPIARRAHDGQGELCGGCFHGPVATCSVCGRHRPCISWPSAGLSA